MSPKEMFMNSFIHSLKKLFAQSAKMFSGVGAEQDMQEVCSTELPV